MGAGGNPTLPAEMEKAADAVSANFLDFHTFFCTIWHIFAQYCCVFEHFCKILYFFAHFCTFMCIYERILCANISS